MLLQMRQFTRSWVSYLLLFVLSALFVLFLGNGQSLLDTLQINTSNQLASGQGVSIEPRELGRALDAELRQVRDQGRQVTRQDAIESGRHLQVLDSLITQHAGVAFMDRLGIAISDAELDEQIRNAPIARGAVTEQFDRDQLLRNLSRIDYSYTEFRDELRGALSNDMMMEALLAGVRAPGSFGALAYAYQTEIRVVSLAEAGATAIAAIPAPTDAQVQGFWEDNQARLRVPEFRALTLVYARPQDFVARVAIAEDRLAAETEARAGAAVQPERRTYTRISTPTEALAREAANRLTSGQTPDAIAAALGAGVQAFHSENQARTDVPEAVVGEAVFSMTPRGAPRVVQGRVSWAVVRVENVTAAVTPNLAELRQAAREAIAAEEAEELMNAAIAAFEDARGGGVAIAEAARQNGLTVVAIAAIDARGRGQDGRPVAALAQYPDLVEDAFDTPEGEASDFSPAGDADVVVAVDRVIESYVRPLAEVRGELIVAWTERERVRMMRELGETISAEIRSGRSLSAVARARGMRVVVTAQALDRTTAGQVLPQAIAGQIFAAREGGVAVEVSPTGEGMVIGVVESIRRSDPAGAPQALEQSRVGMQQSLQSSLGNAIQADIVARARVRRNESQIQRNYPTGEPADQEGGQ